MDNFKIIYKILKILEKAMDLEEFDENQISAEVLKISEARWNSIMEMLAEEGYVKGILVTCSTDGYYMINMCNPRISLKGLEYLNNNSFMKKAANLAKGVSDLIP